MDIKERDFEAVLHQVSLIRSAKKLQSMQVLSGVLDHLESSTVLISHFLFSADSTEPVEGEDLQQFTILLDGISELRLKIKQEEKDEIDARCHDCIAYLENALRTLLHYQSGVKGKKFYNSDINLQHLENDFGAAFEKAISDIESGKSIDFEEFAA